MKKVTINYYLNKRINPIIQGNTKLYPLYVQIIANQKNYKMKSNIPFNNGYFDDTIFVNSFLASIMEDEKNIFLKIVSYLIENNKTNLLKANIIKRYSESLWTYLDNNFYLLFEKEVINLKLHYPKLLENASFSDIAEVLVFAESEIEFKFTEKYQICKNGLNAFYSSFFNKDLKELDLMNMTIFDFLYINGKEKVLKAIRKTIILDNESTNEREYNKIINEIENLISF